MKTISQRKKGSKRKLGRKVLSKKNRKSYKNKKQYGGEKTCTLNPPDKTDFDENHKGIEVNTNDKDVCLPFTDESNKNENDYPIILTHGLGSKNPRLQSHFKEDWVTQILIPGVKDSRYLAYTSRGHGESSGGWETTYDTDKDQFTWKRLSDDMFAIAENKGFKEFIAAGNSIGSATSLYTTMLHPDQIKALIMLRPPKGWNRNPAKKVESGHKCLKKHDNLVNCNVLIGTAPSDYPAKDSGIDMFTNIKCPVLIMSLAGNAAHPIETAEEIHRLIPQSELHIVNYTNAEEHQDEDEEDDEEEEEKDEKKKEAKEKKKEAKELKILNEKMAKQIFPGVIAAFVKKINESKNKSTFGNLFGKPSTTIPITYYPPNQQ